MSACLYPHTGCLSVGTVSLGSGMYAADAGGSLDTLLTFLLVHYSADTASVLCVLFTESRF